MVYENGGLLASGQQVTRHRHVRHSLSPFVRIPPHPSTNIFSSNRIPQGGSAGDETSNQPLPKTRPTIYFRRCRHGAGTFRPPGRHQIISLGPSIIQGTVATLWPWEPLGQDVRVSKCPSARVRGSSEVSDPCAIEKGMCKPGNLGRGRSEADDGSSSRHLGQCADALRCRPADCLQGRVM